MMGERSSIRLTMNEEVSGRSEIGSLRPDADQDWSDYPAGVLWSLAGGGVSVGGFSLSLTGDVPLGAGLSSSASVEVATAMALLGLRG